MTKSCTFRIRSISSGMVPSSEKPRASSWVSSVLNEKELLYRLRITLVKRHTNGMECLMSKGKSHTLKCIVNVLYQNTFLTPSLLFLFSFLRASTLAH